MKETFFRSMTWLHTWVGLLVCWVLLLVFFAGTLSYYRYEITLWSKPELHKNVIQPYDASQVANELERAQHYLTEHAPDARDWRVNFPTDRKPYMSYGWQTQPEEGQRRGKFIEHIAPIEGDKLISEVRESKGGHFFYRLHFDLHYMPAKAARWIIGFCTMFMLVALISGIVIHKRIFKDFFSFRRNKGSRSWLDAHNVSSVIALPYHLMITYTGLVTLMVMYMPWSVFTAYDGDFKAFSKELRPSRVLVKPIGVEAQTVSLIALLPQVKSIWGEAQLKQVVINNPSDQNSRVNFYKETGEAVTDRRTAIIFNGTNGELLSPGIEPDSGVRNTHDTLIALHTGRFAEPILRALFFICGLLGCAMITTGTLLWAVKIRQKQQKQIKQGAKASLGLRLVEGLNLTFITGLPLATAAFFYANRLLPVDMVNRAQWEVNTFFIALACVALLACINRTLAAWRLVITVTATSLVAIPVLNALTSSSHLLSNITQSQWPLVGFDLMCVFIGMSLFFARRKLVTKQAVTPKRKVRTATKSCQVNVDASSATKEGI
ncbi:PepSY domain-containing protein [Shewanella schlegeliana]|uniref:PepSY domain-containing protein n=1 Tax=Shewanella schlegeliana TaxID=190308 RepID=A0ABS1T0N4_9GAMM|nr:PepSY-associated TM helix domain-containing protein [Shewanella schlegeliana]MBL4914140.1 PepSY domain-containing protein [Shewanella schlegeliana]MCL1110823.1 PepSY domain-containing protein [Shewanella schlegeliana]GIU36371.1 peptidase [Shewanella schlegeliana]